MVRYNFDGPRGFGGSTPALEDDYWHAIPRLLNDAGTRLRMGYDAAVAEGNVTAGTPFGEWVVGQVYLDAAETSRLFDLVVDHSEGGAMYWMSSHLDRTSTMRHLTPSIRSHGGGAKNVVLLRK